MVVVRMGGNHVSDFIGKNTYASSACMGYVKASISKPGIVTQPTSTTAVGFQT